MLALLPSLLGGGGGGLAHHRVLEDLGDGGGLVLQHLDGLLYEHLVRVRVRDRARVRVRVRARATARARCTSGGRIPVLSTEM